MLGDRFYIPRAVKKQREQLQKSRSGGTGMNSDRLKPFPDARLPTSGAQSDDTGKKVTEDSDVCSPSVGYDSGNLDQFLRATTPVVPAQYFSKTAVRGWTDGDMEFHPFFILDDLWEAFKEWSAYGAGVPLMLNGSDSVIQYYVPYLSAIQLYADSSSLLTSNTRRPGEESDADSYRDTSSDGSFDFEYERSLKIPNTKALSCRPLYGVNILMMDRQSSRGKSSISQEGSLSDDGDACNNPRDSLIFEFFEHNPPYSRQPLTDKILGLACQFPKLKTLRSCDLLPTSWISVAWYPIYRIPTGPTLRDLDACFLTFHSLSTPFKGAAGDYMQTRNRCPTTDLGTSPMLSLPIFGLASYKFRSSIWMSNGAYDSQQANSLLQAADNWLRLLKVSHPDFLFFVSHGAYWR